MIRIAIAARGIVKMFLFLNKSRTALVNATVFLIARVIIQLILPTESQLFERYTVEGCAQGHMLSESQVTEIAH